MLDINVKTIDGQNRSYSVPDNYSVKQFKEKIANSLNIPIERQRLIFQGRELKDHSLLSEFDVNGKTLHLVQRAPPVPGQTTPQQQEQQSQQANAQRPNAPPEIQNILQQIMGGLGAELGQNVTINTTDQNGMEVHINLENTPSNTAQNNNNNEIRARVRNIRRFLTMAHSRLHRLHEIQSGAPLDDSQNTAIIVGSIQTTATLTDGANNTIAFDTVPTAIIPPIHIPFTYQQAPPAPPPPPQTAATPTTPVVQASPAAAREGQTEPTSTAASATAASSSDTSAPAASAPGAQSASGSGSATPNTASTAEASGNISVEVLSDLISSVMDAYTQFQPYLQQYRDMLVNDANELPDSPRTATAAGAASQSAPASATPSEPAASGAPGTTPAAASAAGGGDNRRQRFCNNINDMMHLLGHLFHNLSDLHVNIRDPPPRQMHTMSTMQYTSSTVISAVPVETNIQIPFPFPVGQRRSQTPSSAPAGDAAGRPATQETPRGGTADAQNISRSRSTSSTSSANQTSESDATARTRTESERSRSRLSRQPPPPPFAPFGDLVSQIAAAASMAATAAVNNNTATPQAQPAATNVHLQQHLQQHQQQHQQNVQQGLHRHLTPLGMPINPAASSYDQFLPCNSVHFYSTMTPLAAQAARPGVTNLASQMFQRRRQPTGNQPMPSSTATPTSTPTTNTSATNANDIGRLVSNLLNSQLRPPGGAPRPDVTSQHIRVNISGLPPQMATPIRPATGAAPAAGQPRQLPDFMNQANSILSQLFGSLGGQPAPQQPQRAPTTGDSTRPAGQEQTQQQQRESPAQMANMLLREAFSLMNSNNPNDQRMNQPVQELLRSLGAETDESGNPTSPDSEAEESSSLNIFNVFFSSMSLGDMINWAQGQSMNQVFERSRLPLRNYIRRTFGSSENSDTESIINTVVESLYNDMFIDSAGLNIDLSQFELTDEAVRQRIDFPKSFEKLMKHHLRILLRHVFDTSYDNPPPGATGNEANSWSSVLVRKFTDLTNQLVVLSRTCVKNADQKFIQIVTEKLNQALMEHEFLSIGIFDNIFNSFIANRIRTILDGVTLTRSSIEQFLVTKEEPKPAAVPASAPAASVAAAAAAAPVLQAKETGTKTKTSVFVEEDDDERYDSASSTISGHSMDIDQCVSSFKASSSLPGKSEEAPRSQLNNEARMGAAAPSSSSGQTGESVNQVFPSEWCSTIEKDMETQKSQQNPTSFSDAYNSGMPAKRRKVLMPKSVDMLNETLFKKVLKRTVEQVELKPNVSPNDFLDTSLANSQLIGSFELELNSAITERLKNDKDFLTIVQETADKPADERFKYSRKRLN